MAARRQLFDANAIIILRVTNVWQYIFPQYSNGISRHFALLILGLDT